MPIGNLSDEKIKEPAESDLNFKGDPTTGSPFFGIYIKNTGSFFQKLSRIQNINIYFRSSIG